MFTATFTAEKVLLLLYQIDPFTWLVALVYI